MYYSFLKTYDDELCSSWKNFSRVIGKKKEPKRGCCARTFSPTTDTIGNQQLENRYQSTIRKLKVNCDPRKCKYAVSQTENEFCSTQKLLDKIHDLKKNVRDLESSQQRSDLKYCKNKDGLSQTPDFTVQDLNSAREALSNCITEMTKLKAFLDDENCWWKMFKKRDFNCCEQKLPHLHGFLDGTMVTLKMLEETFQPDNNFATSTPIKSNSFTRLECQSQDARKSKHKEQSTDISEDTRDKFTDSTFNNGRGNEAPEANPVSGCKNDCPAGCTNQNRNSLNPMNSKEVRTVFPIEQMRKNWNEQDEEADIELSKALEHRISTAMKVLPKEVTYRRSTLDAEGKLKPKYTFSSENTANKKAIAADISTSMELLPGVPYKSVEATAKTITIDKNFSLHPVKMFAKNIMPRSKKAEIPNMK